MLDVITEITIGCPRLRVAAYASDPTNAPLWYANIDSVDWITPPPLATGTQLAFVAQFLHRRLSYTYEVIEYSPGSRLVMRTAEGPFPMETTYEWLDHAGGTLMRLRNRGMPAGFSRLLAPFMAWAVRRANRKDLIRLKTLVEADCRR